LLGFGDRVEVLLGCWLCRCERGLGEGFGHLGEGTVLGLDGGVAGGGVGFADLAGGLGAQEVVPTAQRLAHQADRLRRTLQVAVGVVVVFVCEPLTVERGGAGGDVEGGEMGFIGGDGGRWSCTLREVP
jgi:hypothetical protein